MSCRSKLDIAKTNTLLRKTKGLIKKFHRDPAKSKEKLCGALSAIKLKYKEEIPALAEAKIELDHIGESAETIVSLIESYREDLLNTPPLSPIARHIFRVLGIISIVLGGSLVFVAAASIIPPISWIALVVLRWVAQSQIGQTFGLGWELIPILLALGVALCPFGLWLYRLK